MAQYAVGGEISRTGKISFYVKKNGVKIARGFKSRTAAIRYAKRKMAREALGGAKRFKRRFKRRRVRKRKKTRKRRVKRRKKRRKLRRRRR